MSKDHRKQGRANLKILVKLINVVFVILRGWGLTLMWNFNVLDHNQNLIDFYIMSNDFHYDHPNNIWRGTRIHG